MEEYVKRDIYLNRLIVRRIPMIKRGVGNGFPLFLVAGRRIIGVNRQQHFENIGKNGRKHFENIGKIGRKNFEGKK